jgi:hypothetical protein
LGHEGRIACIYADIDNFFAVYGIDGFVNKAQITRYGIPRRLSDRSRNSITTLHRHALGMVIGLMASEVGQLETIMSAAGLHVKQIEVACV